MRADLLRLGNNEPGVPPLGDNGRSDLNVSALWVFGPSERCLPVQADDNPMNCAACRCFSECAICGAGMKLGCGGLIPSVSAIRRLSPSLPGPWPQTTV